MPNVPAQIFISEGLEKRIDGIKSDTGSKTLIPYRDWETLRKNQTIYNLPVDYCLYRLDNGRIKTKILTYEKKEGKLEPGDPETQKIIKEYLEKSDPKQNEVLVKRLKKDGQREAAVITADGFLINGNRRKRALEQLYKDTGDEKFKYINVVILPGSNSAERPTITDIALLETRYQVQITGKSEYSGMDTALTMRSNVESGILLKSLLADDPNYSDPDERIFEKKIEKFKEDYFKPLELMDEYLRNNNIEGDYERVEDRWLSFQELSQKVISKLKDDKFLNRNKIERNDAGLIQAAAFNLIKLREGKELTGRRTELIRKIFVWLKDSKKDFLKIGKIEDSNTSISDPDDRDDAWQEKEGKEIINIVKKIKHISEQKEEQAGPIKRLEDALWNLQHDDLNIDTINRSPIPNLDIAFKLTVEIKNAKNGLKSAFYNQKKNIKKFEEEHKKK